MIKTLKDFYFYLSEDSKRNGIKSKRDYWTKLIIGSESACAFRFYNILSTICPMYVVYEQFFTYTVGTNRVSGC